MAKKQKRVKRRSHSELIHTLNRRYYQQLRRAERLAADLALLQKLRVTWLFRSLKWLKKAIRSLWTSAPQPLGSFSPKDVPIQGRVSIIIPFRDQLDLLRDCLRSLRLSTYRNYEVILVDNGSRERAMQQYLQMATRHRRYHVVHSPGAFNFSLLCNQGAEQATGDHLLFLNNDTTVITGDWLEQMLSLLLQPEVAIVGATLLYPDDTVQHAGMYRRNGSWDHFWRHEPWEAVQAQGAFQEPQIVEAVSAACLMISRDRFFELNGFDEAIPVEHNDTDLCRRARSQGSLVTVTPAAQLYHYESLSRGFQSGAPSR